jgi:DNA topoisomerase VI subunit A
MSEENRNTITYDSDWQNVSSSEYPETYEYEEEDDFKEENKIPKKKKDSPRQLLITFQLIICIIVALAAFAIKSIGGEVYETVREWYYSNLNNSVIFEGDSTGFNLDALLNP